MDLLLERPPIADQPISAILTYPGTDAPFATVLDPLVRLLEDRKGAFEVLLVHSGGSAAGQPVSAEITSKYPQLRCLHQESGHGYGRALRTGIEAAQHPLVFTLPVSSEYSTGDLARFLREIDMVDIVCGARKGRGWLTRQRQGWLPFVMFGLRVQDVCCPVGLYRRSVFERIPVQSASAFADIELLAKANFTQALISEVEIDWQPPASPVTAPSERSWTSDFFRVMNRPTFTPPRDETASPSEGQAAPTT